jgi:hypothetical protein
VPAPRRSVEATGWLRDSSLAAGGSGRILREVPLGAPGAPYARAMRRPARRTMDPIDLDPKRARFPVVGAVPGTPITHLPTGTVGRVERFANSRLQVRDRDGRLHTFTVVPGEFTIDGVRCQPVVGRAERPAERRTSASGSVAVEHQARVARASRIVVEGVHDAELLEKIWGDDLRHEGIVVERLDGMDDLAEVVRDFQPGPTRRLGVLLDHLVEGSKESRMAAAVRHPHVLITGTPYVDVWQAVRPAVAGIDAWPDVPMGESWKEGVLARLGRTGQHPGAFWRELLASVSTYADLFPPLVGAVEQLIDFVTEIDDETGTG